MTTFSPYQAEQTPTWEQWSNLYSPVEGSIAILGSPTRRLYADIAAGRKKLNANEFDTLLSNEGGLISKEEFAALPTSVQEQARQNPQLFLQSVMANQVNTQTNDLLSMGAQGGYSTLANTQWNPESGLQFNPSDYTRVEDDIDPGSILVGAGIAGLGAWAFAPEIFGAAGAGGGSSWGSLVGGGLTPGSGGAGLMPGVGGLGFTTAGAGAEALGALGPGFFAGETLAGAGDVLGVGGIGGGSAGVTGGGAGVGGGGMLGTGITPSQLASGLKTAGGVASVLGGGTGGASGGTDWGSLIGAGGNAALQNYLSNQQVDNAAKLAESIKFTPYNISSGMGRTYVDPATGEMKSELAPEWQNAQNTLMDSFYGNMQQANMDPMQASQYAYNMGSQLNAYQDEQNRLGLENRLLSQGMLGSTGGGTQMRSLYDSMNQRDLAREAQSLTLGQDMLNQYQNRALSSYNPAWNTQQSFANQVGQSGSLGGQSLQGQMAGANLMNNAFINRNDMLSQTGQNLFSSPMFSGQNGLVNQGLNWLSGSGVGGTTQGWDTGYNAAMNQQGDFNMSGLGGVVAGSDQDMMLNDQWNWGW